MGFSRALVGGWVGPGGVVVAREGGGAELVPNNRRLVVYGNLLIGPEF